MASIYKNLTQEHLRYDKDPPILREDMPSIVPASLKAAVAGAFLLSLICLALSLNLWREVRFEKQKRKYLESSKIQIQQKASSFEDSAAQYKAELGRLRDQLKGYAETRKSLETEMEDYRSQIKLLKSQVAAKTSQPSAKSNPAISAAVKTMVTEAEKMTLPVQKTAAPVLKAKTSSPVNIIKAAEQAKTPEILSVNPKFHFAIINLGSRQGIKIGDLIKVVRNGKAQGSLSVEKVYENYSAAAIVKQPEASPFRQGDRIEK